MEPPSPGGARYYVSFKDDLSGYCVIYFLRFKSEVFDRFKHFVCKIESETNQSVRTLRSDGGGEFISKEFSEWLTEKSIRHEISAAHTPQHNGVSERGHRTI
jgi:transposase InsO family protein